MPTDDLLQTDAALYVEGIGHIAQYDCYVDMLWEKQIPYFVRDYYVRRIEEMLLEPGACVASVRPLVARLEALNNAIREYES
jgi:hypothetical protein